MKHLSLTVLKLMPPIAVAIPFSIKKNKKKKTFIILSATVSGLDRLSSD